MVPVFSIDDYKCLLLHTPWSPSLYRVPSRCEIIPHGAVTSNLFCHSALRICPISRWCCISCAGIVVNHPSCSQCMWSPLLYTLICLFACCWLLPPLQLTGFWPLTHNLLIFFFPFLRSLPIPFNPADYPTHFSFCATLYPIRVHPPYFYFKRCLPSIHRPCIPFSCQAWLHSF